MITKRLAALGVAALLAIAGAAHAVVGPVRAHLATVAEPANATMKAVHAPAMAATKRDGAVVAVADIAGPSVRSARAAAPKTAEPFYSDEPAKAADTPLPGALWLFGGALLAFLGISARRRF
jgi:hypothetical protein